MVNKKVDATGKRLSVSSGTSLSSINTYKSMSTYHTYLTVSTEKFGSASLNRNDSQRLLDRLEFTAEEEMLIKSFRRNASKRSLSSRPSTPTYSSPNLNGNGRYKEVKPFKFGNSNALDKGEPKKLSIETKFDSSFKTSSPYTALNNKSKTNDKKHKKTKSWAFATKDKHSNDLVQLTKEDGFTSPQFVKEHKKKNSSFSIKNLFKKPNNQTEPVGNNANGLQQDGKSRLSPKYDSFETLEHFQNNGNDEEFMSTNNVSKGEQKLSIKDGEQGHTSFNRSLPLHVDSINKEERHVSSSRKNLISLEGFGVQHKELDARETESKTMVQIKSIENSIDEYLANAILLKQNNKFNESTDCLLLAILEYKKKFVLLKSSNKKENLNDRTPFLLYGIALKMGIGCDIDIASSIENLKIAAGLSSPVESDGDDINESMFDNASYKNIIDSNNLINAEIYRIKTKEQTNGMVGPALYELALIYLYKFLAISIDQKSNEILNQTANFALNEVRDGIKCLSLSVLVYNHYDSYSVLLEIYAFGLKLHDHYLLKPNKHSYQIWLNTCHSLDIEIDTKLLEVSFDTEHLVKSKKPTMKRTDTLERLQQLKIKSDDLNSSDKDEYLALSDADSDIQDDTIIDALSIGTSFTGSKKNEFENGAQNLFINDESDDDIDDDLSYIMNTYT